MIEQLGNQMIELLDYDLNNELEENIFEFDEVVNKILPNKLIENDKYISYIIIDNDNDENKIKRYNRINAGGLNYPLAQLKECFEANSSYLHQRLDKGFKEFNCDNKHDDLTAILKKYRNWIQSVAKLNNKLQKQQLIWSLLLAIELIKLYLLKDLIHNQIDSFNKPVLPTFLIIQIVFKLAKIDLSIKANAAILKEKECVYFGSLLGESLWQSHILLKDNLPILENLHSLEQYAS
ncbi:11594_t:CDS:2, partial [Scutellospora calospora]